MYLLETFDEKNLPTPQQKKAIVDFLYENLEQYGDAKPQIEKAIAYALKEITSFGGFVLLLKKDEQLKGAVVINKTGMGGYIPENILVYIATHKNSRGEGLGKKLMEKVILHTQGDIALHVEANNPAKKLYEKYGFTNPYLEMRLKK
ncbi:MAG: GNAT family N-acetyltransferase [Bacteroidetes bacterium]|nr:GNAT family N-acetyltransferase [Bacteroidota bacterium]MCB9043364.1 GNAT family N-acetyltransferase [Chitinophagales bacterium]